MDDTRRVPRRGIEDVGYRNWRRALERETRARADEACQTEPLLMPDCTVANSRRAAEVGTHNFEL